jgi:hypothetical protein
MHSLVEWPELELQRTVLQSVSKVEGTMLTLAFLERSILFGNYRTLLALRQWDFSNEVFKTLRMEHVLANIDDIIGIHLIEMFGPELRLPKASDFCLDRT